MISKKDLKDYDFDYIIDYYHYIHESIVNGQRSQAKSLINDLSKDQKKQALYYLSECDYKEAKKMVIDLM